MGCKAVLLDDVVGTALAADEERGVFLGDREGVVLNLRTQCKFDLAEVGFLVLVGLLLG